jgi:cysteinyl-tRNA synthetase
MHVHTLQVRTALLSDMDTPAVIKLLLELAATVSRYIDACIAQHKQPVPECIESSTHYIHRIMCILGVDLSANAHAADSNQSSDARVVDCIVEFRKKLRQRWEIEFKLAYHLKVAINVAAVTLAIE